MMYPTQEVLEELASYLNHNGVLGPGWLVSVVATRDNVDMRPIRTEWIQGQAGGAYVRD